MAEAVQTETVPAVVADLQSRFGDCVNQEAADGIPTVWVDGDKVVDVMRYLKDEDSYALMYDLSAIDERARQNRAGQPDSDFTVFYHLISLDEDKDDDGIFVDDV